jgi:hypothetical protein
MRILREENRELPRLDSYPEIGNICKKADIVSIAERF